MTRATYNPDNTLTELPGMDKPTRRVNQYRAGSREYYQCMGDWGRYNTHLATLRTLPCSPECRGLWAEGQKLEEGKDYEIKGADEWKWCYQLKGNVFASPTESLGWIQANMQAMSAEIQNGGWLTTKPTFTEECILITASKVRDKWDYNFWLIEKLDDMEDKWYWGILCPDGDEWGDISDLEAEKYLVIPKLTH